MCVVVNLYGARVLIFGHGPQSSLGLVVCLSQVHWFLATGGSLRGRHLSHNAQ